MKIDLIRHTSVNVPKNVCYGQYDVEVTNTFEKEADIVKEKLNDKVFDIIYSSPLTRCKKLANHCFDSTINYIPELMEMNFGDWEMKQWDHIDSIAWGNDWINTKVPNGESFIEMYNRVTSFFETLKTNTQLKRVAIFTHGGVIACSRVYFENIPLIKAFEKSAKYGEIITYEL